MSVENPSSQPQQTQTYAPEVGQGVYSALFAKINLNPVLELGAIEPTSIARL